jgi:UDP-GlcNAc:undecaprenyl-phosphate GlcNAc-1-phosphate transferase
MMDRRIGLIFVLAFSLAAAGTLVMRRIGLRFGVLDRPAARKLHARPVPLLGGVAIFASVLVAFYVGVGRSQFHDAARVLVGATWIAAWGVLDDFVSLRPSVKLLVQLAAAILLVAGGVQVQLPLPEWLNLFLSVFWIVGITNAFNLLDNMDGICAGVGAVAAAWVLLLALSGGQFLVAALSVALLGACLGFLIHNFHPARIFMGDGGSLFIGFVLAALGIELRFAENVPVITWWVPVIALALPIFDTTLIFVSRLRRGRNPLTTPGTDHLSHRLLGLGWSQRRTATIIYVAAGVLGGCAYLVSRITSPGGAYTARVEA